MNISDIQAAIDAGKEITGGNIIDINGTPILLTAEGIKATQFPELSDTPKRIKQTVEIDTAESFIEYFNNFSTDRSVIYLSQNNVFTGIIDHYDADKPAFCNHRVIFHPATTDEWNSWSQNSGKKFNQEDFAFFIEDNSDEIQNPPAAEMLEIATTLKAKTKISFASAKSLANGQTQLTYVEEIDGSAGPKGELKIPEKITIGMRLFKGGDAYKMEARFRYRIREGSISLWYDLIKPRKTKDAAIEDIKQQISDQAKCLLMVKGNFK